MKDEIQTKLAEILTAIQTGVSKGADFAMEQLPDIAQQYVLYGRVWSTIAVLVSLAFLVTAVWVALRFGYLSKKQTTTGIGLRGGALQRGSGPSRLRLPHTYFCTNSGAPHSSGSPPRFGCLKKLRGCCNDERTIRQAVAYSVCHSSYMGR